ncbi:MAG: PspC domain-containing protein [Candidatus Paceibacterota bacterium]
MAHKKLYRSDKDKVIAGFLGGVAEYSDIDATILRLTYVALCLITGGIPFVILYLLAVVIVPKNPKS